MRGLAERDITPHRLFTLLFALAALGLTGCVGSAPHPESIIRDHIEAVRDGDVEAVYERLSPQQRQDMSLEEFRAFFAENEDDLLEEAKQLERALERDKLDVTAGIPIENQGELALRHRDDFWWIDDDPLRFKPLDPPPSDDTTDSIVNEDEPEEP